MARWLEEHDRLAREVFTAHRGYVFSTAGTASRWRSIRWPMPCGRRSGSRRVFGTPRSGCASASTGESVERDGDYFGPVVNTAARIMSAAHGGQIVISAEAGSDAGFGRGDIGTIDLGEHRLKDIGAAIWLLQVTVPGQDPAFPPLRSLDRFVSTLPPRRRRLIGRGAEADELRRTMPCIEHVVGHVAQLVNTLLDRCPEVSVLATSRKPLRVDGEHLVPVGGPGRDDLPVEEDPAIDLLVDRVRSSGVAWRPSADELDRCRELVGRLDRLPLAIELAAARLPHLSVAAVCTQLSDSLESLRTRTRGWPSDTPR
ncbi:MAG: hypothetical protein U5K30_03105 [Acidimicrobiales bacterium]|nr:hypothetical protein [Acidimicrobiales bacterium]